MRIIMYRDRHLQSGEQAVVSPDELFAYFGWLAYEAETAETGVVNPSAETAATLAQAAVKAEARYEGAYEMLLVHRQQATLRKSEQMEAMWQAAELTARIADGDPALIEASARLEIENHQLRYNSTHDRMTGVYNRGGFLEASEAVLGGLTANQAAVVFMADIDGLKTANDTIGHEAGDRVLRLAAQTLQNRYAHSTVGRWGGDEFVALHVLKLDQLEDMDVTEKAAEIRHKLTAAVMFSLQSDELLHNVQGVGISIGQSDTLIFGDKPPASNTAALASMVGSADQHMYAVKSDHVTHTRHSRSV